MELAGSLRESYAFVPTLPTSRGGSGGFFSCSVARQKVARLASASFGFVFARERGNECLQGVELFISRKTQLWTPSEVLIQLRTSQVAFPFKVINKNQ